MENENECWDLNIDHDRGVRFEKIWFNGPVKVVLSIGEKRYSILCGLSMTKTAQSWKFGPEIQFNFFTKDPPKIESRSKNNGYTKAEMFFPAEKSEDLLRYLKECSDFIKKEAPGDSPAGP